MKTITWFTAFYWDNYQGGSGKHIEDKIFVDFKDHVLVSDVENSIREQIINRLQQSRPFQQQREFVITKIEIV